MDSKSDHIKSQQPPAIRRRLFCWYGKLMFNTLNDFLSFYFIEALLFSTRVL